MGLTANFNAAASVANRFLADNDSRVTRSLAKLSAGSRVVSARDDAASLAIGSRLRSAVASLSQARVNAGQAVSMLQIADGAAAKMGDILVRMKTLAVQSGSGQLSVNERHMLNGEFLQLKSELDRIGNATEFNGQKLLKGDGENIVYTVRSLPTEGSLTLDGTALVLGQSFTQADVDSGRVLYLNNGSVATMDRLIVSISDADGNALGTVLGEGDKSLFETAEYLASTGLDNIKASTAYARGGTGAGAIVAVIDSGILLNHADLDSHVNDGLSVDILDGGLDGGAVTTPDGNDDADPTPSAGHGTHVAGIIGALKNDTGVHGVAYEASLFAVKVTNTATGLIDFNDLADAIDYATDNGAHVINMSLGTDAMVPVPNQVTAAISRAVNAGVVVVAATGNSSMNYPGFPARFSIDPTAKGMLIAVAAVDDSDVLAGFSNHPGGAADYSVVAPGVAILSTTNDGLTGTKSGTSMATPFVAGSIAVLRDLFPDLSGAELANLLITSARDLGDDGIDVLYGRGIVDLDRASLPQYSLSIQIGGIGTGFVVASGQSKAIGSGSIQVSAGYSGEIDPGDASFVFKVGAGTASQDKIEVGLGALTLASLGLASTAISSAADADTASALIDAAMQRLVTTRAGIGASQNRLEFSESNLTTVIENTESARSILLDLDIAAEMAQFTSLQVLTQANVSMSAQANQSLQNLMRLMQ